MVYSTSISLAGMLGLMMTALQMLFINSSLLYFSDIVS